MALPRDEDLDLALVDVMTATEKRVTRGRRNNREQLPSSFKGKGEIEHIDISYVTPGSINETMMYEFEDAPSRACGVVKHGDIIWSCVRPNRRSYAVLWNPPPNLIASTGFAVLTPHTDRASHYIPVFGDNNR